MAEKSAFKLPMVFETQPEVGTLPRCPRLPSLLSSRITHGLQIQHLGHLVA